MAYKLLFFILSFGLVSAFTGDDRFLRKYAMMKVYESCFGPEVVKEVRMEMEMAASKCAQQMSAQPQTPVPPPLKHGQQQNSKIQSQVHKVSTKTDPGVTHRHRPHLEILSVAASGSDDHPHSAALHSAATKAPPSLDLDKLQQAILAGYTKHAQSQASYPPESQSAGNAPYYVGGSVRPHTNPGYLAPPAPSYYYPSHYAQSPYAPTPVLSHHYPAPSPYYSPQPVYPPPYQHQYYPGRSSRDLDVRGQLETLTNRMSGRIRNVTCVMQELGYLDSRLEPDYGRMLERIGRLPVQNDLKRDMAEAVDFCRQFSQCVPEDRKDKMMREMVRPMFFFRCYKHKKLEACIMKDVRDRYSSSPNDLTEDNLTGNVADGRSVKGFPEDGVGSALYEFLYGDGNIDLDTVI